MRVMQALNDLSSTERIFKKICVILFSVFWSSAFGSHPLDALNGSNKLPLPGRFVAASRRSSIWTANLERTPVEATLTFGIFTNPLMWDVSSFTSLIFTWAASHLCRSAACLVLNLGVKCTLYCISTLYTNCWNHVWDHRKVPGNILGSKA